MIVKIAIGAAVVFLAVWAWKIHIYLKWQKRKERDEAPFTGGPMKSTSGRDRKKNFDRQKKKTFPFILKVKRSVSPG